MSDGVTCCCVALCVVAFYNVVSCGGVVCYICVCCVILCECMVWLCVCCRVSVWGGMCICVHV